MKLNKQLNLVFLFILFLSCLALADILPTDTPCAITGVFYVNGSIASSTNLTLEAKINGTQYKNMTANGSGSYYMTLGGHTGDIINVSVCGINHNATTFASYSVLTLNVNATLAPSGSWGCTCSEICNGTCVNPGSTGVCSSTSYYCDSDDTCESNYGETTSTCSSDCPTSSSGGGGGGGSSGTFTSTPMGTVGDTTIAEVQADVPTTIEIDKPEVPVDSVTITVDTEQTNVRFRVETIQPNSLVSSVPQLSYVYTYLKLELSVADPNIKTSDVEFSVPKSWFTENNYDYTTTTMQRFVNGEWVALQTILKSESAAEYHFVAVSPGFSYFAITALPKAAAGVVNETEQIKPKENVTTVTEPVSEVKNATRPVGSDAVTQKDNGNILIGLVIIAIIVAVGIGYYRSRRHVNHHKHH